MSDLDLIMLIACPIDLMNSLFSEQEESLDHIDWIERWNHAGNGFAFSGDSGIRGLIEHDAHEIYEAGRNYI